MKRIGTLVVLIVWSILPGLPPRVWAATKPVRPSVRVVMAMDARLPAPSKAVVEEALKIAAEWIEVWYQKRIRFEVVKTVSVDSYMASHLEKLPVPDKWKNYPYSLDGSDSALRFMIQQTSVLRGESLPVLLSYVPESVRPLITSPEEAARNLLLMYDAKVRLWRSLRTPKGAPFFDTGYPKKHSYWHWERVFESVKPDEVKDNLIVTNVMLLDNALTDAPPHSLIRGGLLNGFSEEEAAQAIVSTFPIFTDIPAVNELRDTTEFSKKDRLMALAHIIAHELGVHVIQGYKDVYDHSACLAVPTSGLAYRTTIRRLFEGPACRRDHPMINRRTHTADRYESLAFRYLELKDYASAKGCLQRALALDPRRPLLGTLLRQLEAKK